MENVHTIDYIGNTIYDFPGLPDRCIIIGCISGPGFYEQDALCSYGDTILSHPITSPIYDIDDVCFMTVDKQYIQTSTGLIKYPDDIGRKILCVMYAGLICYDESKEYQDILFNPINNMIITSNYDFFTLDECYVGIFHDKIGHSKYHVKMVQLITSKHFNKLFELKNSMKIQNLYSKSIVPKNLINECHKLFYSGSGSMEIILVKCLGGNVNILSYLRPFFGNHSPIFHRDGFDMNTDKCHGINYQSFQLIINWLFRIILKKKYPSDDMIVENETNVDEWIYICDYFDIPCLLDYFKQLHDCLED